MFLPSFLRDPVKVECISWPMVYVMVILRCSDWWYIQLSEEAFFFPGSVETRPIITTQWICILTKIMSMTSSGYICIERRMESRPERRIYLVRLSYIYRE